MIVLIYRSFLVSASFHNVASLTNFDKGGACVATRRPFNDMFGQLPRYSPLRWPWHFLVPQIAVRLRAGKKGLPPQRRFGKSLEQLTWKRHGRRKEDHPESDIRVTSTNFQVVCILCYEARFNVKRGLTWREVWREGRFNAGMNPLNFHLLLSSRRHIAIRNPRDNIPQALKT